ncbi:MAG: hypothetical protein AAB539_03415 [Patescibacteria group bacterium]
MSLKTKIHSLASGKRLFAHRDTQLLAGVYFAIFLVFGIAIWDAGVFYRATGVKKTEPADARDQVKRRLFHDEDLNQIIALLNERDAQYKKFRAAPILVPGIRRKEDLVSPRLPATTTDVSAGTTTVSTSTVTQ